MKDKTEQGVGDKIEREIGELGRIKAQLMEKLGIEEERAKQLRKNIGKIEAEITQLSNLIKQD